MDHSDGAIDRQSQETISSAHSLLLLQLPSQGLKGFCLKTCVFFNRVKHPSSLTERLPITSSRVSCFPLSTLNLLSAPQPEGKYESDEVTSPSKTSSCPHISQNPSPSPHNDCRPTRSGPCAVTLAYSMWTSLLFLYCIRQAPISGSWHVLCFLPASVFLQL